MKISNWNGNPQVTDAKVENYGKDNNLSGEFCIRGKGRSYGDASLAREILDLTEWKKNLNIEAGVLMVSAGFTVEEVLNFCVPKGWFLPVIPGTRHVTVGGMIAADVHGKNHEKNGTIGRWVESLEIQLESGEVQVCDENDELFHLTIGGLGLTGIILSAKIRLTPLESTRFEQNVTAFTSLNDLLDALWMSQASYKAGWFDFYRMSNFLLIENDPGTEKNTSKSFRLPRPKIKIPFKSVSFVRPFVMKWYNKRYARKMQRAHSKTPVDQVLFPLDRIANWNYLYGKNGFYQLQFSFDREICSAHIDRIISEINNSGFIPTLAVIKKHGTQVSPGILSFPRSGFSFAFDFAYSAGIEDFLKKLNSEIADAGGRVYLVKDALLTADNFEKMYPEAVSFREKLKTYNQGKIASLLSKRLNLTP